MVLTVILVLVALAIGTTIAHAMTNPSRPPLWIPIFLLCLIELIRVIPLR